MLRITDSIAIDENELQWRFVRAAGPGGQNVNKVATAAQLRFDVRHCTALPADLRERLARLAGSRMTARGVLVIEARRFRTQERNRADALERLAALLRRAAEPPKVRRATKVPVAAKRRRLEGKQRQARKKRLRAPVAPE
jgi:ribosome-associated protein